MTLRLGSDTIGSVSSALIIAIGIGTMGFFIGQSLEHFKSKDCTVTVKGLSEQLVRADLAVWTLNFRNSGNDLTLVEEKTAKDHEIIIKFLQQQGFVLAEIEDGSTTVIDKFAREWSDNNADKSFRFITDATLTIRTGKIDLIKSSYPKIGTLIRDSIVLTGEPVYYFTKFLELKTKMLAEASQNALTAAEQILGHSTSRVGKIREARQGTFSVRAQDSYNEDQLANEGRSIEKKIRVVNTITYNLE